MILASPERIAEYTAQGWWGARTLHTGFAEVAARHPQREAVVDASNRADLTDGAPRRLMYAQLADEVDQLAVRLWRLGLRRLAGRYQPPGQKRRRLQEHQLKERAAS